MSDDLVLRATPGKTVQVQAKWENETEKGWADVENQVMEMSTSQLLDIYDLFEENATVFTTVANELMHRRA